MIEQVGNLFDYEDENNVLIFPVCVAFKRTGALLMDKGNAKKAAEYYPDLPNLLGGWYKAYSREIYHSFHQHNILAFPVKLKTKELTNKVFVEIVLKRLALYLETSLINGKTYYFPARDPLYEDVDVLAMARDHFCHLKNVIILTGGTQW